ncbi:hypothetical protein Ahy_B08g090800 [Arachis hypogaea]|uniref:Uncharacterized protein n=1 Tax=Arachis hypogaea TaxID=3818 RepID=A0A444Y0U6_ARAHY|nr:hypothetical protein Ahy_B08g090800 [Arachis hypogaea]
MKLMGKLQGIQKKRASPVEKGRERDCKKLVLQWQAKDKLNEDNDLESAVSSTDLRVPKKNRVRFVEEKNYADEVLSFMEQLLNDEDLSQTPNISNSINSEQDKELARTPSIMPLNIDDWRCYDKEEKNKLLKIMRAKDGIEPSRVEIFLKIHKRRKDGRPLDEESAKTMKLIEEKLNNGELSNEESINGVAWEGDVYSQVLGSDRSGYVRSLGLGPTSSLLWGNKLSYGKFASDALANEVAQKLQQEIKVLKEKNEEEMKLMKENQNKMFAELFFMRQVLYAVIGIGITATAVGLIVGGFATALA